MSLRREFKAGFGRASGYWIGKAMSIGATAVVVNDIVTGKAAKRLDIMKAKAIDAKDKYVAWINR